jgi:hypothetical protein
MAIQADRACQAASAILNLTVNIPHTLLVFTCAHPKWQNSQSDDGGRSTEEEEMTPDDSFRMDVLHNGMLNARVLQFLDGLWSGISLSLVSTFVRFFVI